ncbi:RNA polymerase sigma factor SigM [Ruminiclostridium hungatei]|uniref:RNA polymerase sigma factor SigM n=1 Tax=Ruminiclostridium hungatei TaxID=48256 RepID=A0A1V4SM36_RUMHU|nr:RNA polymerase sigma factor [Ruminiclostridium hungatei]OPX44952.1 RNA polymerase sigma factor SigM [Ruminiclostridium hungatei]
MEADIFAMLYRDYYKIIYRYLYSLTFNRQKAEDLTQDVFVKAMCLMDFPDARIKSWLLTVAHNLHVDYIRKNSRVKLTEDEILSPQASRDIQDEVEDRARLSKVISKLRLLPENQRQAVVLCLINELSYQEAAVIMGVSVSAVTNLIYRARKTLREKGRL